VLEPPKKDGLKWASPSTNTMCSSHPDCVALARPECCPTQDGVFLDCCDPSYTLTDET
jgi:hypothetical protein